LDEEKYLVEDSGSCARCMMRLVEVLIIALVFVVFILGYLQNKSYLIDNYSTFQVSYFFAV